MGWEQTWSFTGVVVSVLGKSEQSDVTVAGGKAADGEISKCLCEGNS